MGNFAARAYAWTHELPDGKNWTFCVLHLGDITGPAEAVRASLKVKKRR